MKKRDAEISWRWEPCCWIILVIKNNLNIGKSIQIHLIYLLKKNEPNKYIILNENIIWEINNLVLE